MKTTWIPELDKHLAETVNAAHKTPVTFVKAYRNNSGDNIHTVGGILTRLEGTILPQLKAGDPGETTVLLTREFLRDFRRYAEKEHAEKKAARELDKSVKVTTTRDVRQEPGRDEKETPMTKPSKPHQEPTPERISATEAGGILGRNDKCVGRNDKCVAHNYERLNLGSTVIRVRGAPTRFYCRKDVVAAAEAPEPGATSEAGLRSTIKALLRVLDKGIWTESAFVAAVRAAVEFTE